MFFKVVTVYMDGEYYLLKSIKFDFVITFRKVIKKKQICLYWDSKCPS